MLDTYLQPFPMVVSHSRPGTSREMWRFAMLASRKGKEMLISGDHWCNIQMFIWHRETRVGFQAQNSVWQWRDVSASNTVVIWLNFFMIFLYCDIIVSLFTTVPLNSIGSVSRPNSAANSSAVIPHRLITGDSEERNNEPIQPLI